MILQKTGDTYIITDTLNDTATKGNVLERVMKNAILKHIVYKGTKNPLREEPTLLSGTLLQSDIDAIERRKNARRNARLVNIITK